MPRIVSLCAVAILLAACHGADIAQFWRLHHVKFARLTRVDNGVFWLNTLFFEEYTVWLDELLDGEAGVPPAGAVRMTDPASTRPTSRRRTPSSSPTLETSWPRCCPARARTWEVGRRNSRADPYQPSNSSAQQVAPEQGHTCCFPSLIATARVSGNRRCDCDRTDNRARIADFAGGRSELRQLDLADQHLLLFVDEYTINPDIEHGSKYFFPEEIPANDKGDGQR